MGARLTGNVKSTTSAAGQYASAEYLESLLARRDLGIAWEVAQDIGGPVIELPIRPEAVIEIHSDEVVGLAENETDPREALEMVDGSPHFIKR